MGFKTTYLISTIAGQAPKSAGKFAVYKTKEESKLNFVGINGGRYGGLQILCS